MVPTGSQLLLSQPQEFPASPVPTKRVKAVPLVNSHALCYIERPSPRLLCSLLPDTIQCLVSKQAKVVLRFEAQKRSATIMCSSVPHRCSGAYRYLRVLSC